MLYNNQLYNKHLGNLGTQWRCIHPKYLSALSADIESFTITKDPDDHIAHGEVLDVRLAVMRAIKSMKSKARDEPDMSLKTIYDRNRKKCLDR